MRPPFPGMDPWLESPTIWPDVHSSLITSIRGCSRASASTQVLRRRGVADNGTDWPRYRSRVQTGRLDPRDGIAAAIRGIGVAVLERPEVQTYSVSVPVERGDRRDVPRDSRSFRAESS